MPLRPEEVTSIIKKELEKYKSRLRMESVGTVLQVGDGIALAYGLDDVMAGVYANAALWFFELLVPSFGVKW